jgi:hypothetical protein
MGKALEQVEKDLLAVVEACAEVALLQLRVLVQRIHGVPGVSSGLAGFVQSMKN